MSKYNINILHVILLVGVLGRVATSNPLIPRINSDEDLITPLNDIEDTSSKVGPGIWIPLPGLDPKTTTAATNILPVREDTPTIKLKGPGIWIPLPGLDPKTTTAATNIVTTAVTSPENPDPATIFP